MAKQAKAALRAERLEAVADRGYFNSEEILACEQARITVTLPKPMTSGAKAEGRFGKQDFVYQPAADVYRCPAGATLKYRPVAVIEVRKPRADWWSLQDAGSARSRAQVSAASPG